ncbi:hypothetical protein GHK68_08680 [Sinorhizobium meliloti]|uniref:nucleotidyltransferase domain-containing protein n=1 Tax=Rhizobium meliloti TaxID=382 RepID=UPI0012960032|nr:nucleotidyltransferase domain-containing protein [Sinorhizobium meliloti]MQW42412.1 hypothetical protein [Sinorhizobium meliloti]
MENDRLTHLPDRKRRELQRAAQFLFDEFEETQKPSSPTRESAARILKLILFGSYARGDFAAICAERLGTPNASSAEAG